jgi:glycosyltransferase involved in cell wall biosynthesis
MKFCFFGNIAGALKGKTEGGAELQISLLARALALKGHEVVIVDPYSSESFVNKEGIRVVNIPDWDKGVKGIRLFRYRIPALKKIFLQQNADFYYVRMRSYLHLFPYLVAKKINSKLIIATAHDLDLLPFYKKFKYEYKPKFNLLKFITLQLPNDFIFNYLIKHSDYVLLQHKGQKDYLKSVKGKVVVFPNIFDFGNLSKVINSKNHYFIYPGTLNILKGSENLKQLIKILDKKISIVIVGQPKDRKTKKIYDELKNIKNIVLTGRLNHRETIQMIANARALINTSNFEGFPNIFLEAWATGVPVISLKVNPGNVFNEQNLGIYCNEDLNKMKNSIESGETDNICKNNLISYVREHHDFTTAADRFLKIINNN